MINEFDKTLCIVPQHFAQELVGLGYSKQLALFLSLKRIYKSNHIHNYKSVKLDTLGYSISRKTYMKYINILCELKLVKREKNGIKLIGVNKMVEMFECKEKIKYSYLPNDKDLRTNLEKLILQIKIRLQNKTIHSNRRKRQSKEIVTISKTVRGQKNDYNSVLKEDTSLTCESVAIMLGFKSKATGYKREVQFAKDKFIDKIHREIFLGKISKEIVAARRSNSEVLIGSSFNGYKRILANELTLRSTVGLKPQPKEYSNYADAFGQF